MDLINILGVPEHLSTFGFFIRATVLFFGLLIATRLMSLRHIGLTTPYNILAAASISHIGASRMVYPNRSVWVALIVMGVFTLLNILISYLFLKWDELVYSPPLPLMEQGKIDKKNMKDCHLTIHNLIGLLRLQHVWDLKEVEYVFFEPKGKLSVFKKAEFSPPTKKNVYVPNHPVGPPAILIYEGKVDEKLLKPVNHDMNWLLDFIKHRGYPRFEEVFLLIYYPDGSYYIS